MTRSTTPVRLAIGDTVRLELPYSEVCLHMKIAGAVYNVELLCYPGGLGMAQVLAEDGRPFGAPVTPGEAGIYIDSGGFYAYPEPFAQ